MFGARVVDGLDDECQLIVESSHVAQHLGVGGRGGQSHHLGAQRVINGDADIVDGWSWVLEVVWVEADCVGKANRG